MARNISAKKTFQSAVFFKKPFKAHFFDGQWKPPSFFVEFHAVLCKISGAILCLHLLILMSTVGILRSFMPNMAIILCLVNGLAFLLHKNFEKDGNSEVNDACPSITKKHFGCDSAVMANLEWVPSKGTFFQLFCMYAFVLIILIMGYNFWRRNCFSRQIWINLRNSNHF